MSKGIPAGVAALQLLELARKSGPAGLIHITTDDRRAKQIARILAAVATNAEIVMFPPWDCLPYDRASPSREVMGQRMAALRTLARKRKCSVIVVTTPEAALQRVPPRAALRTFTIRTGELIDPEELLSFCKQTGYVIDERVDEAGEAAFRGEVIDIFPAGRQLPCRLEVRDGRLEAIRSYDALSQRTVGETPSLVIDAASELPQDGGTEWKPGAEHHIADAYPALETLLDYLPDAQVVEDPSAGYRRQIVLAQFSEASRDRGMPEDAKSAAGGLYITEAEWHELMAHRGAELPVREGIKPVPAFATNAVPASAFAQFLRDQISEGRRIVLSAPADGDLSKLARRAERVLERKAEVVASWNDVPGQGPGALLVFKADLEEGFVDEDAGLALVTARDVLGSRAREAEDGFPAIPPWRIEAADLHLGDLVAHADYGIGILRGLERVETAGESREAIRLSYAHDTVLLTPVDEAHKLWRYGSEEGAVALDRLDTDGWLKRRAKIQAALAATARVLIARASERERLEAPRLMPPHHEYERFVARFPFPETPGQRDAIEAVLNDMASGRPMDRLVVGDVGFGKTEVALRAAAAAALSDKQVGIVTPTTVLARQHFNTFCRRFAGLGINVAHLSRLVTGKEAQRVKEGLREGKVQIVVGTHALAGKTVEFADLGLIVIDEEHRFGAAHKQKLRDLAHGAHVLSLSATPIPRTLQTALAGLQDLSTILTAPSRRRPIRTFAGPFNSATIQAALRREKRRGGQGFVVVPRIEDIEAASGQLKALAPELDFKVAHGKLPAREVDAAMVDFADGRGDVLLATNIIESGLDVPRANTMVVLRADLFGLAELHQLRGRVGRGHVQAVCHLMTEPGKDFPDATAKRLGALQAFDRLGAGLAIAARDLDLRGAGDLIGEEQAGHVKLIGLGLYQELLATAVKQARGEAADKWTTEFQIEASASVPEEYIPDAELRINLYYRAARASEPADIDQLADEIADRFGPPPPPVQCLLALASARTLARSMRVVTIVAGPKAVALTFEPGIDPKRTYADNLARLGNVLQWSGERLVYRRSSESPEERLNLILELLEELRG